MPEDDPAEMRLEEQFRVLGRRFSAFRSFNSQGCQNLLQSLGIHEQLPAVGHHILDFVEGLEQTHLDRAVLFGFGEGATVTRRPVRAACSVRKTLTAKVVFRSEVTSKMYSVAASSRGIVMAVRFPTK